MALTPAEILQVSPEASSDEIKKAHRRLAQIYHPDKADAFMRTHNEQIMKIINQAYQTLLGKAG